MVFYSVGFTVSASTFVQAWLGWHRCVNCIHWSSTPDPVLAWDNRPVLRYYAVAWSVNAGGGYVCRRRGCPWRTSWLWFGWLTLALVTCVTGGGAHGAHHDRCNSGADVLLRLQRVFHAFLLDVSMAEMHLPFAIRWPASLFWSHFMLHKVQHYIQWAPCMYKCRLLPLHNFYGEKLFSNYFDVKNNFSPYKLYGGNLHL